MRQLIGIFTIICVCLTGTFAQLPNTKKGNKPPVETVKGIVKIDTRAIENLPIGKEITGELKKLKYVSRERISGDDWNLRLEMNLDKTQIVVERFGHGFLNSFPLTKKKDMKRKILEIIEKEAMWQAVNFLDNRNPNPKVKINLRVMPHQILSLKADEQEVKDKNKAGIKRTELEELAELREGDYFRMEVTNYGSIPVYITIVNLSPNGEMKTRSFGRVHPNSSMMTGGTSFRISASFGLESVKVIATAEQTNLYDTLNGRLPDKNRVVLNNDLNAYLAGLPNSATEDAPTGDWATVTLTFQPNEQRTLHVLSVGVNEYGDSLLQDLSTENDVREFAASLKEYGSGAFDRINAKVLHNAEATKDEVITAFKQIIERAKPQDAFVFQFSGHSAVSSVKESQGQEELYLMTFGAKSEGFEEVGISNFALQTMLSQIQARQQFLVLDTSFSTKGFDRFISKLKRESNDFAGLIQRDTWIYGVDENSHANEIISNDGKRYGLMSYSLIKGLSGEADKDGDALITVKELTDFSEDYTRSREHNYVDKTKGERQKQKLWQFGNDFVLAKTKPKANQSKINFQTPQFLPAGLFQTQQTQDDKNKTKVRAEIVSLDGKSPQERQGKDYALLIATDEYANWNKLNNPINDAETIAKELKDFYGFEIDAEKDFLRNPKRRDVLNALTRIKARKYEPDDQLFIFIAGHGHFAEEPVKAGYLVFNDTLSSAEDPYFDSFLEHAKLRQILDQLGCKHIFVIIDACFGGTFDEEVAMRGGSDKPKYADATNMEFLWRKMQFKTRRYLTSGGKEYVSDGRKGYHSPFASKFIEALRDYGGTSGLLTINGILSYVERANPTPMEGRFGTNESGSDFIFTVKKNTKH